YYNFYDYNVSDNYYDNWQSYENEVQRLSETVAPSESELTARAQFRNQQAMLNKLNPQAPFAILESSLKTIGDKGYFVSRIRNKSDKDIASLSFMYPGIKGPVAQVENMKPGQVVKIEALLPQDAVKDNVQIVFAAPQ